jgi:hypothetical protein
MSSAYTFKSEEEAWPFIKKMLARGEDLKLYRKRATGQIQVAIIYYSPGYKKSAD